MTTQLEVKINKIREANRNYMNDEIELRTNDGDLIVVTRNTDGDGNLVKYNIILKQIQTGVGISMPIYSQEVYNTLVRAMVSIKKRNSYQNV